MPLEVTPVPFSDQQLPYTPKFARPDLAGSLAGPESLGRGPAAAAASAIIPAQGGSVATPQRAIPALPEAGYTAPSIQPASMILDPGHGHEAHHPVPLPVDHRGPAYDARAPASMYGYDGRSAYGTQAPRQPPPMAYGGYAPTISTVHDDGWAASSLPAPRRAPIIPHQPVPAESVIAPRHHHHHHHHHHHLHSHTDRGHLDDDAVSDASYYSKPKIHRHYSGSALSSPPTGGSTIHEHHHHRSGSMGEYERHQHRHLPSSPHRRSPSVGGHSYPHSPGAPFPLSSARGPPPLSGSMKASPLSPKKVAWHSYEAEEERPRVTSNLPHDAERERRPRKQSSLPPDDVERYSRGHGERDEEDRYRDKEDKAPPSEHGREERGYQTELGGQHRDKEDQAHHIHNDKEEKGHQYERDDSYRNREDGRQPFPQSEDSVRIEKHRHHALPEADRRHRHHSHHTHHRHHARHSVSNIPPQSHVHPAPFPAATTQYVPTHHSAAGLRPPIEDLAVARAPDRRRAVSMQGEYERPQPVGAVYQAPSVAGVSPVDMYDDGASMAGSAMTFMDGAVQGRVSQYGLPKYAHQPKMDYRRFCVQRGNADVFLD